MEQNWGQETFHTHLKTHSLTILTWIETQFPIPYKFRKPLLSDDQQMYLMTNFPKSDLKKIVAKFQLKSTD